MRHPLSPRLAKLAGKVIHHRQDELWRVVCLTRMDAVQFRYPLPPKLVPYDLWVTNHSQRPLARSQCHILLYGCDTLTDLKAAHADLAAVFAHIDQIDDVDRCIFAYWPLAVQTMTWTDPGSLSASEPTARLIVSRACDAASDAAMFRHVARKLVERRIWLTPIPAAGSARSAAEYASYTLWKQIRDTDPA